MTNFVESLHRLFLEGKITQQKVEQLLKNNKISREEYSYIISK